MQHEQPTFYANLAQHLSAEEQSILQNIVVRADEVAAQLAASAAANASVN